MRGHNVYFHSRIWKIKHIRLAPIILIDAVARRGNEPREINILLPSFA